MWKKREVMSRLFKILIKNLASDSVEEDPLLFQSPELEAGSCFLLEG